MKRTIQCYTGISGSGKTSTILQLSQKYIQQGWNIGGIATIGNFQNNKRDSFWVIDILAPEIKIPLAKRDYSSEITIGCFGFQKKGIEWGNDCINRAIQRQVDILFIDEIGPLELSQRGWYPGILKIVDSFVPHIVFTSRPSTLQTIRETFFGYGDIEIIEI